MNPERFQKVITPLLTLLLLAALFVLAAGLTGLEFKKAERFEAPASGPIGLQIEAEHPLLRTLLILCPLGLLLGLVILMLVHPKTRRQLPRSLLRILPLVLLFIFLVTRSESGGEEAGPTEEAIPYANRAVEAQPGGDWLEQYEPGVELVAETPFLEPDIPAWWTYVASLLTVLAAASGGWWLWRSLQVRPGGLSEVGSIAQRALADLEAGRAWEDAVIACYARMTEVLAREQNLHRPRAMTAAEFARGLERAGLPAEPVQRLTRLFEKARYGVRGSSGADAAEAAACLRVVLGAIGVPG
jgi:hypothetical protein